MFRYIPFEETLRADEIGIYRTYGIVVLVSNVEILRISDVSTSSKLVNDLCQKCNIGKLSPIHLYDVLEDNL